MHSMPSDHGKESNTAKGINTATEFNQFKGTLFNKKVIRHKMKKTEFEHMKAKKHHCHLLMIKRFVLDYGIHTLAYFHKEKTSKNHLRY